MEETIKIFENKLNFPDLDASRRFNSLVGIDDIKKRLVHTISILINPEGLEKWAKKFYSGDITLLKYVLRRPPLVILTGDVGTGKTELATTVGDPVARMESIDITLFPLSLATRGSGRVGEMTKLMTGAFEETYNAAKQLKIHNSKSKGAIILLVDEGDAIVQSRENSQMHHEDRAGVNTFIRGIDRLSEEGLPAMVILCTNRFDAIDPAVRRRATEVFSFQRPNQEQRKALLNGCLTEIGFSATQIDRIVEITGATDKRNYSYTYSDITQRLLPSLVVDVYPDNVITFERAVEIISSLQPTTPFHEYDNNNE